MALIYARLDIGNSRTRLAFLRNRAASNGTTWQKARANGFNASFGLSPGFNTKDYGVREDRYPVMLAYEEMRFRAEEWADECEEAGRTVEHHGWYSDADCSRTLRAFVYRLPHGRWGCGYADSDSGERVYLLEEHPDASSAASSADSEAKYYAEKEKEYNERWHAAHEKADSASDEEKEIARLFALRNHAALGEDARQDIGEHIAELRALRASLKHEYSDIEL